MAASNAKNRKGGGAGGSGGGASSARAREAKRRQGKNKIDGPKPTTMDEYRDMPRQGVEAVRRSLRRQSGATSRRLRRSSSAE